MDYIDALLDARTRIFILEKEYESLNNKLNFMYISCITTCIFCVGCTLLVMLDWIRG